MSVNETEWRLLDGLLTSGLVHERDVGLDVIPVLVSYVYVRADYFRVLLRRPVNPLIWGRYASSCARYHLVAE